MIYRLLSNIHAPDAATRIAGLITKWIIMEGLPRWCRLQLAEGAAHFLMDLDCLRAGVAKLHRT